MPYDLSKPLVIGISSRALFNLEQENKIFEEQGVEAYEAYQVAHENEILQKGAAFQLIKAFLELNNTEFGRLVEVIIMSRNNANTCLRIFNSIQYYGLDITRATLTSGAEIAPYLKAFKTDLFCQRIQMMYSRQSIMGLLQVVFLRVKHMLIRSKRLIRSVLLLTEMQYYFLLNLKRFSRRMEYRHLKNMRRQMRIHRWRKGPFANFLTKIVLCAADV